MKKFFHYSLTTLLFSILLILILNSMSFATILGDVDNDGQITSEDARLILRKSLNFSDTKKIKKSIADVDLDGEVTPEDARIISRAAVNDKDEYYRCLVLKRAYTYKAKKYTAKDFGYTYDWCMAFVGRCFSISGRTTKSFNVSETSCSMQIYNICRNNPKEFTSVISKSAINAKHTSYVLNKVKNANFNKKYIPKTGDVLFLDNNDSHDIHTHIACHTGFVTHTKQINGKTHIYTIEGNVDGTPEEERAWYLEYYQTSKINTKEYIVLSNGTFLTNDGGKTYEPSRQILGYYTPTFNY